MTEPNFNGVQFETLRRKIDPPFIGLVRELDIAYYGHWRQGVSYDFHGRDPIAEGLKPRALFDQLHGNIWNEHTKALIQANIDAGFPYPEDKINPIEDEKAGTRKLDAVTAQLSDDAAKGIALSQGMSDSLDTRKQAVEKGVDVSAVLSADLSVVTAALADADVIKDVKSLSR